MKNKTEKSKFNVHQAITDQLLEAMQASDGIVKMPWHHDGQKMPVNVVSGKQYRGSNVILLWMSTLGESFTSNQWATFKQWQTLGGTVRKGEASTMIMFYKLFKIVEGELSIAASERGELVESSFTDANDQLGEKMYMMARAYRVFNRSQIDGLDEPETKAVQLVDTIDTIEEFVQCTKADIHTGGGTAAYFPSKDRITMPDKQLFTGTSERDATESWYATLLHELSHWTGAKHRLNRNGITQGKSFGSADYAFEELVAELGSAFLCAELGVSPVPREDHAHYLKHWISKMQDDRRFFTKAASQATALTEYLHSL